MNAARTVTLTLEGIDGNAFSLMAAFRRQARREGWTAAEIGTVLEECMKGDYAHLVATLMNHCEPE